MDNLPHHCFNWFDVTLVVLLLFGLWRGRKHGMSKEFLPVSQWISIMVASALSYPHIGDWLMHSEQAKMVLGKNHTDRTAVFVSAYLAVALLVFVIFVALRRHLGPKLTGSTLFGGGEYYLGMISGTVRYACMMIVVMALLNAPVYTAADIQAKTAYNAKVFGGGQPGFKGDFFPGLDEVQASVFRASLTGPLIRDNLSILLINPAPPAKAKPAKDIGQP